MLFSLYREALTCPTFLSEVLDWNLDLETGPALEKIRRIVYFKHSTAASGLIRFKSLHIIIR
jgi:hypothetical protein